MQDAFGELRPVFQAICEVQHRLHAELPHGIVRAVDRDCFEHHIEGDLHAEAEQDLVLDQASEKHSCRSEGLVRIFAETVVLVEQSVDHAGEEVLVGGVV